MEIRQKLLNLKEVISNLTWAQTKQFFYSLFRWAKSGFKVSALSQERLSICKECPHYKKERCMLCGCYTPAKTRWFTEQCPIEKW